MRHGDGSLVVAVEATRLAHEQRGIGRYVRALLPRLATLRPDVRLTLFAHPRDAARLEALHGLPVRPIREMPSAEADVFWYPWNIVRPAPRYGAVVVTIHDIVPVALPDPRLSMWRRNLRWRRRYAATARRATIVVASSAFTALEVHRMLDVPYDRMRVVLLAADDTVIPPTSGDEAALARLGVQPPFVLAVGAAEERKNLALLERAMPRVAARVPALRLVLAGPRGPAAFGGAEPSWKQTLGYVSDDELAALYRAAECLVMPSRYEGFGLPVLEAMRLGTPVIGARTSSLPEVGGGAVAWVDPDDDAALAERIGALHGDAALRASLGAAGQAQAARFTWDDTARRTLDAFDEAVARHRATAHASPAARRAFRGLWRMASGLAAIALGR